MLVNPANFAARVLLVLKKYLIFLLRDVSLRHEHLVSKLVPLRGGRVGNLRYEVLVEVGNYSIFSLLLFERSDLIHGLA